MNKLKGYALRILTSGLKDELQTGRKYLLNTSIKPHIEFLKLIKKETKNLFGMLTHACNSSTQETEAGELSVQGQSGLHHKFLPT
jgi:hypothetical protein